MKNSVDNIQFHWRLIQSGEENVITASSQNDGGKAALPDVEAQGAFCKLAQDLGIASVLIDINYGKPDPMLLPLALAKYAPDLGYIIAIRSGLISPTLFTQQINTLSTLIRGKIFINIVAGYNPAELKTYGDFLPHDERYARTGEFLDVCTRFWNKNGPVSVTGDYLQVEGGLLNTPFVSEHGDRPFLFISGGSQPAIDLTEAYGDCWMQLGEPPEKLGAKLAPLLEQGKSAGLRFSVICRETMEEALAAAFQLKESTAQDKDRQTSLVLKSDSYSLRENMLLAEEDWPSSRVWTGLIKSVGPTGIALVGSYEEIALKIMEFKRAGVTHFILSGWPKLEEMKRFGTHVMPLVRNMEKEEKSVVSHA
ncbi:LLM class flavin-dependent oxidoreductase [Aureisphaera galaxeae]|uniref:LLM class flavin-dependent oxidoreductase n=1 Tax=Aureisphaera galaxeae TaxID=1538023 RepID=UPI0023501656|nr:LLM class flavin-dependent oxidoreductase [Aureisphaera galaxeae]MDC8005424.1 LLM class flavin-dependent oxidoreductase [Aureisphaera galaxeae]